MSDNNKKKKGGAGNIILVLILIACIAVACFAAYKLISIGLTYKAGEDEYAKLQQYTRPAAATPAEEEPNTVYEAGNKEKPKIKEKAPVDVDIEELKKINPDFAGWLYLEAEEISYPVVHAEDNDYYLHRTFEGAENFAGTLFVECLNKADFSDPNTIIYGHNMKNQSMFGKLKFLIENQDYTKSDVFWIITEKGAYKYQMFNVSYTTSGSDVYTLFSGPCSDVVKYINARIAESAVKFPLDDIEINENSKIVTLSTCGTVNTSERLVVQGILIGEN